MVAKTHPYAQLHLVDISGELSSLCRDRLGENDRFSYEEADFSKIDYEPESFNLIVSSIAIHHINHPAKQQLFKGIFSWLTPGGWLAYNDQFSGATPEVSQNHTDLWYTVATELGSSQEDWRLWMEHQDQHDHHATITQQFAWLAEAGFQNIDCPWRYLLWTVVQSLKPSQTPSQRTEMRSKPPP